MTGLRVVGVGNGIGTKDNIALVKELADVLHARVGLYQTLV